MTKLYYLDDYKPFDSTQELNFNVKQHTNKRYYDMNETERQVLQLISEYGVIHDGACHLKIQTIADGLGKSRRTIERAIRSLIKLNVIDRLNTSRRVSGGKGANIYIIKPYLEDVQEDEKEDVNKDAQEDDNTQDVALDMSHCNDDEKPRQAKDTTPIIINQSANSISSYITNRNTYSKPSNTPYTTFKSTVRTFLGDSIDNDKHDNKRLVSRLYGVYLGQTKALRKAYDPMELIELGAEAIRITFAASKRIKLNNIAGYYNGVLSQLLDGLYRYEVEQMRAETGAIA